MRTENKAQREGRKIVQSQIPENINIKKVILEGLLLLGKNKIM